MGGHHRALRIQSQGDDPGQGKDSGAEPDGFAVVVVGVVTKSCPHCGSQRLSLVDIYHKPQQIPTFLLPKREPDNTT